MKKMKRKVTLFMAAMLFAFAFAPAVKAAEVKREVGSSFELQSKESVLENLGRYGAESDSALPYMGGAVYNLKQVKADQKTVTVTWSPATGAVRYLAIAFDAKYQDLDAKSVEGTTATLNLQGAYPAGVLIVPVDANGTEGTDYDCAMLSVYAVPAQVKGLKINGAFADGKRLGVVWSDAYCYGFEACCYNRKGKQIQVVDTSNYRSAEFSKTNTVNIYSVKVKPYVWINNNTEKLYGPVSKTLYAVPQPKITSKNSDIKTNSMNLKWKKVTGATKYEVYVSTKVKGGFKKVATVKSSKNSCLVTKYKGTTINLLNRYYYAKVVTYAKFGKKTVKSQSNTQVRGRVKKKYY